MIRTIIIEDEKPAARYLSKLLNDLGIDPLALLNSVKESVDWLKNNEEPDLIFLDIQLGDGISFEIFEKVQPESSIIFTTAYDDYAIRAFKFNSIDYLLKPIGKEDLKNAIEKFKKQQNPVLWDAFQLKSLLSENFGNRYRERFLLKVGNNLKTFLATEVCCFFSRDKSTYLFSDQREYPMEQSLSELEEQLDPNVFFRISRNAIVNLHYIDNIIAYSGSRYQTIIKGLEEELIVSRERVPDFKMWLEK